MASATWREVTQQLHHRFARLRYDAAKCPENFLEALNDRLEHSCTKYIIATQPKDRRNDDFRITACVAITFDEEVGKRNPKMFNIDAMNAAVSTPDNPGQVLSILEAFHRDWKVEARVGKLLERNCIGRNKYKKDRRKCSKEKPTSVDQRVVNDQQPS